MVGPLIASGEAEIGFQQTSELVPVPGVDYIGPLPAEVQRFTVFAGGIVTGTGVLDAAKSLLALLASPAAVPLIEKAGLQPVSGR